MATIMLEEMGPRGKQGKKQQQSTNAATPFQGRQSHTVWIWAPVYHLALE